MAYVLIVIFLGSNGAPVGGMSAEFASKSACEQSGKSLGNAFGAVRWKCDAKS